MKPSAVKDVVIGSSLVAVVVLAQRGNVAQHGAGWRARVQGACPLFGPTRQSKAAADVDASQFQAAWMVELGFPH